MRELRATVVEENPRRAHDLSWIRRELMFRAILECGYEPDVARQHAESAFLEFFEARHRVEYFEGALDVLTVLAENYLLAVLTNGNADLERLGLDRFFKFGASAEREGVGKPAPEIFHAALVHAGAEAHEAIHVGDDLIHDVQGATEVGMYTVWVNTKDQSPNPEAPRASGTVNGLGDLPAAVEPSLPTYVRHGARKELE